MAIFFYLILSAATLMICDGADMDIINGDEVSPHSRPYMALIRTPHGEKVRSCAGTLIRSNWVLTAAHCNMVVNTTSVILGAHSVKKKESVKQVIKVIGSFKYKSYSTKTKQNDIQLLKIKKLKGFSRSNPTERNCKKGSGYINVVLKEFNIPGRLFRKAELGKAVKTLPLPKTYVDVKRNTVCEIAGWGRTEKNKTSDKLMKANVSVMSREECKEKWKHKYEITQDMMCTNVGPNREDTCKGDSGSPLVCNGIFRAINSFGYMPCGTLKTSNVFTRLTKKYISWIEETISDTD